MNYIQEDLFDDLQVRHDRLQAEIIRHYDQRGDERCWENDAALYRAAGLDPGDPDRPSIADHRQNCDAYRAELYGVPVGEEPCALVEKLRHENAKLEALLEQFEPEVSMDGMAILLDEAEAENVQLRQQVLQLRCEKTALLQELTPSRPVSGPDLPALRPAADDG